MRTALLLAATLSGASADQCHTWALTPQGTAQGTTLQWCAFNCLSAASQELNPQCDPANTCLRFTTGTRANNQGTLDVYVDQGLGAGKVLVSTGRHEQGELAYAGCFMSGPTVAVSVQNPSNDAWSGILEVSTDGGNTFTTHYPSAGTGGWTAGTAADQMVVDGNDDSQNLALATCLDGAECLAVEVAASGASNLEQVVCQCDAEGSNPDHGLWQQFGADHSKCPYQPALIQGISEVQCQLEAMNAGHHFFSWRDGSIAGTTACFTSADCSVLVHGTINTWRVRKVAHAHGQVGWQQMYGDHTKCPAQPSLAYGLTKAHCQDLAVLNAHQVYSWRDGSVTGQTACFTSQLSACAQPVTGTTNAWNVFRAPVSLQPAVCPDQTSYSDCTGAKDSRAEHIDQPCAWCCGDDCDSVGSAGGSGNRCEPTSHLLSSTEWNNQAVTGTGLNSCPAGTTLWDQWGADHSKCQLGGSEHEWHKTEQECQALAQERGHPFFSWRPTSSWSNDPGVAKCFTSSTCAQVVAPTTNPWRIRANFQELGLDSVTYWPQLGSPLHNHMKCPGQPSNINQGLTKLQCQQLAITAGHDHYSWRDGSIAGSSACFTKPAAECTSDVIIGGTTNFWRIFKKPDVLPVAVCSTLSTYEQCSGHQDSDGSPCGFCCGDHCPIDVPGDIEMSGNNPGNPAAGSLQECTQECDHDAQCAAGLLCFQRQHGEKIPGCSGPGGGDNWDYCYDPAKALTNTCASLSALPAMQPSVHGPVPLKVASGHGHQTCPHLAGTPPPFVCQLGTTKADVYFGSSGPPSESAQLRGVTSCNPVPINSDVDTDHLFEVKVHNTHDLITVNRLPNDGCGTDKFELDHVVTPKDLATGIFDAGGLAIWGKIIRQPSNHMPRGSHFTQTVEARNTGASDRLYGWAGDGSGGHGLFTVPANTDWTSYHVTFQVPHTINRWDFEYRNTVGWPGGSSEVQFRNFRLCNGQAGGWTHALELECCQRPTNCATGSPIQVTVASSSKNWKSAQATGLESCWSAPANAQNDNWRDTFTVEVHPALEQVTATRTDSDNGWGQTLVLDCCAVPVPCESGTARSLVIGNSGSATKTVTVAGIQTCSAAPQNTQSNNWRDTFLVEVDRGAASVTVERSDQNSGWGQRLQLACCVEPAVTCASTGDPHVRRFDRTKKDNHNRGYVKLYERNQLKIESYQLKNYGRNTRGGTRGPATNNGYRVTHYGVVTEGTAGSGSHFVHSYTDQADGVVVTFTAKPRHVTRRGIWLFDLYVTTGTWLLDSDGNHLPVAAGGPAGLCTGLEGNWVPGPIDDLDVTPSCTTLTTEDTCVAAKEGTSDACIWCCGDDCPGGSTCAPFSSLTPSVCVRITTGTEPNNQGQVGVLVDDGTGPRRTTTGFDRSRYYHGDVVHEECFQSGILKVWMQGGTNDAWSGTVEVSYDNGNTYTPTGPTAGFVNGCVPGGCTDGGLCDPCTAGTGGNGQHVFDGNSDSFNQGSYLCHGGDRCRVLDVDRTAELANGWNGQGLGGNGLDTCPLDVTDPVVTEPEAEIACAGVCLDQRENCVADLVLIADLDDAQDVIDMYLASCVDIDGTDPVLVMVGPNHNMIVGETYHDLGAKAHDNEDGDIGHAIVFSGSAWTAAGASTSSATARASVEGHGDAAWVVNTAALGAGGFTCQSIGTYKVHYDVQDAAGNAAAQATRYIYCGVVAFPEPEDTSDCKVELGVSTCGAGEDDFQIYENAIQAAELGSATGQTVTFKMHAPLNLAVHLIGTEPWDREASAMNQAGYQCMCTSNGFLTTGPSAPVANVGQAYETVTPAAYCSMSVTTNCQDGGGQAAGWLAITLTQEQLVEGLDDAGRIAFYFHKIYPNPIVPTSGDAGSLKMIWMAEEACKIYVDVSFSCSGGNCVEVAVVVCTSFAGFTTVGNNNNFGNMAIECKVPPTMRLDNTVAVDSASPAHFTTAGVAAVQSGFAAQWVLNTAAEVPLAAPITGGIEITADMTLGCSQATGVCTGGFSPGLNIYTGMYNLSRANVQLAAPLSMPVAVHFAYTDDASVPLAAALGLSSAALGLPTVVTAGPFLARQEVEYGAITVNHHAILEVIAKVDAPGHGFTDLTATPYLCTNVGAGGAAVDCSDQALVADGGHYHAQAGCSVTAAQTHYFDASSSSQWPRIRIGCDALMASVNAGNLLRFDLKWKLVSTTTSSSSGKAQLLQAMDPVDPADQSVEVSVYIDLGGSTATVAGAADQAEGGAGPQVTYIVVGCLAGLLCCCGLLAGAAVLFCCGRKGTGDEATVPVTVSPAAPVQPAGPAYPYKKQSAPLPPAFVKSSGDAATQGFPSMPSGGIQSMTGVAVDVYDIPVDDMMEV